MTEPITLTAELDTLTEFWSQRVVAEANGNLLKVAKGVGSTRWHPYDDQDEVFLLAEGALTVQLRDRSVELRPGDPFVVPRGVEHCPVAEHETRFLFIDPPVTFNDARGSRHGASPRANRRRPDPKYGVIDHTRPSSRNAAPEAHRQLLCTDPDGLEKGAFLEHS